MVSDYGGVDIVYNHHHMTDSIEDALALCLNNGLDLQLHNTNKKLLDLVRQGKISEKSIDEHVRRVLKIKFELGLFEEPFVDAAKAGDIVRSEAHRQLAYECACKSITLLKNNGILPLRTGDIRRIGVYGPSADVLNLGDYSGGRGGWRGDGITPYEGLRAALEGTAEVVLNKSGQKVETLARTCDVLFFFPSITEEEGSDRSSFHLPSAKMKQLREETGALIVADQKKQNIRIDQERMVRDLIATGKPVVVVLHNGAVIDITTWVDGAAAVVEAWYPGEQGGRAIADVVTGKVNPSGRLPISWAKSIGQNPMYYSIKPSGRGYGYVENNGRPLYPFGYGLSYTTFEYSNFEVKERQDAAGYEVTVDITNTGDVDGDEVVQVYIHDETASVVRPMKQLAAFGRVGLNADERKTVRLEIPRRQFALWDKNMHFGVEEGWFEVWLGRNADAKIATTRIYVKGDN